MFPSGWNNRVQFVINPDTSAFSDSVSGLEVSITQDAAGFPSAEIFTGDSKARPNGGDIRFTSGSDGTGELPSQVEQFNQDTSAFNGWVKLPDSFELSGTSQNIYMWWGVGDTWQVEASASTGLENVWTNYTSVWHLNDTSGSSVARGSTVYRNHGTYVDGTSNPVDVAIGKGQQFTDGPYITIPNQEDYNWSDSAIVECWVSANGGNNWEGIVTKGDNEWRMTRQGSSDDVRCHFEGLEYTDAIAPDTTSEPLTGGLHYIVAVYDGSDQIMYVDGVEEARTVVSAGSITSAADSVMIGNHPYSDREFNGLIDEVRVGPTPTTGGFVRARYDNVTSQSTFVSAGTAETVGSTFPDDWSGKTKFTINPLSVVVTETIPVRIPSAFVTPVMWDNVQDDGGDLRITSDEAGTLPLPMEKVFWDNTISACEIWVETPVVSGVGGSFWIWYNTSGAELQPVEDITYGRYNTWGAGYQMVQHMIWKRADTPEGEYGFIDSTHFNNDATETNGALWIPDYNTYSQLGITCASNGIGSYFPFGEHNAPLSVSGFTIPHSDSLNVGSDNVLLEGHVSHEGADPTDSKDQIFQKRDDAAFEGNYEIQLNESSNLDGAFNAIFENGPDKVVVSGSSVAPIVNSTFYYVGGQRIGDDVYIFVNGVSGTESATITGDVDNTEPLAIGFDKVAYDELNSDFEVWDGNIDEIRLTSGVSRSTEYIQTQTLVLSGEEFYESVEDSGVGILVSPWTNVSGAGSTFPVNIGDGDVIIPFADITGVGGMKLGELTTPYADVSAVANVLIPTISVFDNIATKLRVPVIHATGTIHSLSADIVTPYADVSAIGWVRTPTSADIVAPWTDVSGAGNIPQPNGTSDLILPWSDINATGTIIHLTSADIVTPWTDVNGTGSVVKPLGAYITTPFADVSGSGSNNTGSINLPISYDVSGSITVDPLAHLHSYIPLVTFHAVGNIVQFFPTDDVAPQTIIKDRSQHWARDISKSTIILGEVYDEKAINISLENIMMTLRGERLFNPNFGTILPSVPFEILDQTNGEDLLNILVRDIRRWEKRIIVISEQIEMDILPDENAFTLVMPYLIKRTGLTGTFARKIRL